MTQVHDLTSDKEILKFINTLDCHGGGDGCEAALDGLSAAATEIHWRESSRIPSLRYIFHICDQPPHVNDSPILGTRIRRLQRGLGRWVPLRLETG